MIDEELGSRRVDTSERSMFTLDGAALPDALVLHLHVMNNITIHGRQGTAVFMRTLRHGPPGSDSHGSPSLSPSKRATSP